MTSELQTYISNALSYESSPHYTSLSSSESQSDLKARQYLCACPTCGKSFKFRSELDRHLTVHTKARPYSCTFPGCGKSFKRSDALASHYRGHVKARSFECTVPGCDSTFTTKSALKYHNLRHQAEKKFKCTHEGCSKSFINQTQLKQHEKNHNGKQSSKEKELKTPVIKKNDSEVYETNDNSSHCYEEGRDECSINDDFGTFFDVEPALSRDMREFEMRDSLVKTEDVPASNNHPYSDVNTMLLHLYQTANGNYDELISTETSDGHLSEKEARREMKFEINHQHPGMVNNILFENDNLRKKFKVNNPRIEKDFMFKNTSDIDQFFDLSAEMDFDHPEFIINQNPVNSYYYV